jgi:hypothetical protein
VNRTPAVTAPRIVVPGATTAITRRTTLRKAFLGPWHPLVSDCWLYALADAQRHTEVAVHHSTLVVNHHHTSVTPTHANLPEFVRRFHRDFSCALHALLCAHRYDAPRELFDDRQAHMMRLLDPAAQAGHLVYERLNPVAAGLVRHPDDMPQRVLDFGLWKTGYVEVERPPVYFGAGRPERLRLFLTPPPLLYQAFEGDVARLVHHLERLTEDGARALREARRRPPMGAKALRRLHPWSEPRTMREPGGGRVPSFKVGARGWDAVQERIAAAREVRAFRQRYAETRIARRDGDTARVFPFGTYAMRAYHGAPVEPEPWPEARVSRPGPVLSDFRHREDEVAGRSAFDAHELTDAVREAVRLASAEIVAEDELDFVEAAPVERPTDAAGDGEAAEPARRQPAVVRHRYGRRADAGPPRVITLRDRRRGRPPSTARAANDPPR